MQKVSKTGDDSIFAGHRRRQGSHGSRHIYSTCIITNSPKKRAARCYSGPSGFELALSRGNGICHLTRIRTAWSYPPRRTASIELSTYKTKLRLDQISRNCVPVPSPTITHHAITPLSSSTPATLLFAVLLQTFPEDNSPSSFSRKRLWGLPKPLPRRRI